MGRLGYASAMKKRAGNGTREEILEAQASLLVQGDSSEEPRTPGEVRFKVEERGSYGSFTLTLRPF